MAGVITVILILAGGIGILWYLANSQWVDQQLSRVIERLLKRYGGLDVKDYDSLLQLSGDYRIAEIGIECEHWLCEKKAERRKGEQGQSHDQEAGTGAKERAGGGPERHLSHHNGKR